MPNWPWFPLGWRGPREVNQELQAGPEAGRGRPRGTGMGQQVVRDILREKGTLSTGEVAREYHNRRDGPSVEYDRRAQRAAESTVGDILRALRRDEEVVYEKGAAGERDASDRRRAFWTYKDPETGAEFRPGGPIAPAQGGPKRSAWSAGHAKAGEGDPAKRRTSRGTRYEPLKEPTRHEPSRPISKADQDAARHRAGRGNTENWGSNTGRADMAAESDRNRQVRGRFSRPTDEWNQGEESGGESKEPWHEKLRPSWEEGQGQDKGQQPLFNVPGVSTPSDESQNNDDNGGDDDKGSGFLKPSW